MSMKDFQIISRLGEGSYSSVWKVKRKSDGQEYAMKKVKLAALSQKEKENALNEVRILASINNANIIGYKEAFLEDDSMTLCIVMEYAAGGDIYNKILMHQKAKTFFKEEEVWRYAAQMLLGLKMLHDMKILHRDLKCANIFISKDCKAVKLGDLNVSKITKGNIARTQTGTPYYASPEVWKDLPYDAKSDIWSLGCVIYEMCALKPPFRANDMQGLYRKVQRGVYDRIPSQYSAELANFVGSCLQVSPSMRPLCDQLLKHPLLEKHSKDLLSQAGDNTERFQLLNTIKFPKNVKSLGKQLPKPKYGDALSMGDLDEQKSSNHDMPERNVFTSNGKRVLNQVLPPLPLEEKVAALQMASPKDRREFLSQNPREKKNSAKREKSYEGSILSNSSESDSKGKPPIYKALKQRRIQEDKENLVSNRNDSVNRNADNRRNVSKLLDPLPSVNNRRDSSNLLKDEPKVPLSNKHEYIINKYQNDYKIVDKSLDKKPEDSRRYSERNEILSRRAEYLLQKYNVDVSMDKSPSGRALPKINQSPSNLQDKIQAMQYRKMDYQNVNQNRYDLVHITPRPNINHHVNNHAQQRGVVTPAWWG